MEHYINNIINEEQYESALVEVERLIDIDPEPGTKEFIRLECLSELITKHEDEHYPIDFPSENNIREFRKDQMIINNKK